MINDEIEILVLYTSKNGGTKQLAEAICSGIESIEAVFSRIRTIPELKQHNHEILIQTSTEHPSVDKSDLLECSGLLIGSPTRFGNMSASMKLFLDSTLDIWISGDLINKPAGVFTSTSSLHGGQESTLITMMLPLIHHGMIIVGLPYSEPDLNTTSTGGTPYGASHVSGQGSGGKKISDEEFRLAFSLGKRVAEVAKKLQ